MDLRKVPISIGLCLVVGGLLARVSTRPIGEGAGDVLAFDEDGSTQEDKSESYTVARVTDHQGVVKYEVLLKDKVKERRERLMAAYDVALKKHTLDMQDLSEDDKQVFACKPTKPKILIVVCNLSKDKATAKADKLQREHAKKQDGVGLFTGN